MVGISDVEKPRKRKSHANSVAFSEEEEIINPEDVDPSVGKFRNMIQTTIIPTKVSMTYHKLYNFDVENILCDKIVNFIPLVCSARSLTVGKPW